MHYRRMLSKLMKTQCIHAHIMICGHTQRPLTAPLLCGELKMDACSDRETLRGGYGLDDRDSKEERNMSRPVTRTLQDSLSTRGLTVKKSLHEQGEMLSGNSTAFCCFGDHALVLG